MTAETIDSLPPIRTGRKITGMSAILLPMLSQSEPDWTGFRNHVDRTVSSGLIPAVNMDTGYAHLISESERQMALDYSNECCNGGTFVGGVFVGDQPGDAFNFDAYRRGIDQVIKAGGTPIIFQSFGLTEQSDDQIVDAYQRIADHAGKFIAFELGKVFAPFGKIYSLGVYEGLLSIDGCIGAKHSSLSRVLEWQRLRLRDQKRPEFKVLTGNDLAIDMVMYGSDYLLGLSTFAPDAFAKRDAMWESGDAGFYELNDLLQYLGAFTFRAPVPAYKHSAAMFLKLRGMIDFDFTYPGSTPRPDTDLEALQTIADDLKVLMKESA